jgi:hypothetical protein
LILGQPGLAQPSSSGDLEQAVAAIRGPAIRAHMRFLADDRLEGRATATRGYDIAAKYVAANFETLGLEPAGTGGSYFQPVRLVRLTTAESQCSLAILRKGRRKGRRTELRFGPEFFTGYLGKSGSVTAPVVFAGYGMTAPELGRDDYAGVDVRGKIVAVLGGMPAGLSRDQRALYSDPDLWFRNAAAHGAAGLLIIAPPALEQRWEYALADVRSPDMTWIDEAGRPGLVRPLAAVLRWKTAEGLFAGAPHSLADALQAAEAGRPTSFELPLQASLHIEGRSAPIASPNVVAVLPGSDPRLKDEYVVLSASLDSLAMGAPAGGDAIYNGASDAAGVAALLEVARAFTRLPVAPRRSVLFLATAGEAKRPCGSEFFVHFPTRPAGHIVADVNLDMSLMLYPLRDVVAFGADHSTLEAPFEEAARRLGIAVSPNPFQEWVMLSRIGIYPFLQEGIPALTLTAGFLKDGAALGGQALWEQWLGERYRRPDDDMSQTLDFGAGEQLAKMNFLVSYLVAQDDKAPGWNPGDFFGGKLGRK